MILIITLTNYSIHKIIKIKWQEVRPGKIRKKIKERGRSQITEGVGRARGATEHLVGEGQDQSCFR